MPFTFAHPAIVIPLKRISGKWLNLTALIFGSMAPDFEYFIRMKTITTISHSIVGIFVFNLPLVIVLSLVFHWVIKMPLIVHLPKPFDRKFSSISSEIWRIDSIKKFIVFIYSALIGIVSHLIWDSFTHKNGIAVEYLNYLNKQVNLLDYQIAIYKLLQHGSTLIGLILIFYFVLTCPKLRYNNVSSEVSKQQKKQFWFIVITITLLVTAMRVSLVDLIIDIGLIGILIVTIITGSMIGLTIASIISRSWIES